MGWGSKGRGKIGSDDSHMQALCILGVVPYLPFGILTRPPLSPPTSTCSISRARYCRIHRMRCDDEQVEFLKAQLASEQTLKAEVEAALGEERKISTNTQPLVSRYRVLAYICRVLLATVKTSSGPKTTLPGVVLLRGGAYFKERVVTRASNLFVTEQIVSTRRKGCRKGKKNPLSFCRGRNSNRANKRCKRSNIFPTVA